MLNLQQEMSCQARAKYCNRATQSHNCRLVSHPKVVMFSDLHRRRIGRLRNRARLGPLVGLNQQVYPCPHVHLLMPQWSCSEAGPD